MTHRIAALPMYDADRPAVTAWWRAIGKALTALGVADVPPEVIWPENLPTHWRDPRLLLGQTCGYPLVTGLDAQVRVVGAFRYTAPGCAGIGYRSELVARVGDGDRLEAYRGRVAAINGVDSHSGCNALRGVIASHAVDGRFFREWRVSGSHRQSLAMLRLGAADIAAIDCISLELLCRREAGTFDGLQIIASTPPVAGLPLITAADTGDRDFEALRNALAAVCADPALTDLRQALCIGGFEPVSASAWQGVDDVRLKAFHLAWE